MSLYTGLKARYEERLESQTAQRERHKKLMPTGFLWWRKCPECGQRGVTVTRFDYPNTLNTHYWGYFYECQYCDYEYPDGKVEGYGD